MTGLLQRLDGLRGNHAGVLGLLGPLAQHGQQLAHPADYRLPDVLSHRMSS